MPGDSMMGPDMGMGYGDASGAAQVSLEGRWEGQWMDSSGTHMGGVMQWGWMMGAGRLGSTMWDVTYDTDGHFEGQCWFSDFTGRSRGTISGQMTGNALRFTMTLPAGSLPGNGCSATASGTARLEGGQMRGTYSGTNSCTGDFGDGQMQLTHE